MKIDKHISDLLYRYDCVIVPELGGFVCNYSPARIQPVQHSFTPPSKNIVFNSNLRNNDGLLANHISQEERTSFKEANLIIQRFVNTTNDDLGKGKRVSIEDVGTLFMDVERNLQFEPEGNANFLLDSFGLNTFHSPAIKREGITLRLEKEFKDRINPKEKTPDDRRRINIRRMVAAAILIPLVAAMVWIPLKTDLLNNVDLSSVNPFSAKENPMYKPSETSVPVLTEKDLTDKTSALGSTDATTIKLTDGSSRTIVVSLTDENVTKPDTTSVVAPVVTTTNAGNGNFYIIGGCFEVYSNATRFAQSLRDKGYHASILSEKLGRLSPVAYTGGFATMEEAVQELAKIQAQDPNAWILSR